MRNIKQQEKPKLQEQIKVKRIVTTRENGTRRVQQCYKETYSRTKQEFMKDADINNIVQYPLTPQPPLTYADLTTPPDLRQIFKSVHEVTESFHQLPSNIRKLMDNDPAKMEAFIADKSNQELLIQQGVLIPREIKNSGKKDATTTNNSKNTNKAENASNSAQDKGA